MRRSIALLITIAISSSVFSYADAAGIQDNQSKLNEIKKSIQQNKDKLNNVTMDKNNEEKEVEKLDKDMEKIALRLQELNSKIINLNSDIKKHEKEIELRKQEFSQKNEIFKERVRAIYKAGNRGYLDIILNSKSFSDFISRIDTVKRIIAYDKNLIDDIKSKQQSLEKNRSDLENTKKNLAILKDEVYEKYKLLQASSNVKKQLVAKLERDKSFYERIISKEQSDSEELSRAIQRMKSVSNKIANTRGSNINASSLQVNSEGKLFCITGTPYPITSSFGMRFHPVLNYSRLHAGIDIGVQIGTPIYALKDGVVIAARAMSGYGNVVMIDHGDITSVYAHNSSLAVSVGQTVNGGQLISYSGNSGISSGPHLHFEIRNLNGQPIQPDEYYVH